MADTGIRTRLRALRRWMEEERIDAFIVPTTDPHNSEYTPAYWKCREWLTGFTGSAGTVVVTAHQAALWTDSRYFLQAESQLSGTSIQLMREGTDGVPTLGEWLNKQLPQGAKVSFSAEVTNKDWITDILSDLDTNQLKCMPSETDPFTYIWSGRPDKATAPIVIIPEELTGEKAGNKLRKIYQSATRQHPDAKFVLVNDLSEIAWALNLRGSDIEYNPVFMAYLAISAHRAILFTDPHRVSPEVTSYLLHHNVTVQRYGGWKNLIEESSPEDIFLYPPTMNLKITEWCKTCKVKGYTVEWHLPEFRAIKNPTEQAGFREAMERDGVALIRFLRHLEENVKGGKETELTVDEKLTALRAEQPGFCGLSFATIAGYESHGAIVHYEATSKTASPLQPKGLLLLDSGAQYDCGTTDITRTIALGPVTEEESKVYTLVLKGHIALSRCHFPEGTTGLQLDLAARYDLWQHGYDFGHGTGHGVGHRLCVHEGPHQIRKNPRACTLVPFQAGMTITDEPGVYVTGHFGVRIENTLLVVPAGETPFGHFLSFEPLTLCPIDRKPINRSMLTETEVEWIDNYHATVRERLLPRLHDEADRNWLKEATKPL